MTANPQGMSFKEPIPALSNVMDTRDNVGSAYVPVLGALSSPNRAPSPTCPFIKTDDVKEPTKTRGGQLIDPRFTPGDRLSVLIWRPKQQERKTPQRRSGDRAYMEGPRFRSEERRVGRGGMM